MGRYRTIKEPEETRSVSLSDVVAAIQEMGPANIAAPHSPRYRSVIIGGCSLGAPHQRGRAAKKFSGALAYREPKRSTKRSSRKK
jgi:hypothetical protein